MNFVHRGGRSPPPAFLQTWFDGESLYSWAARFHHLQGRTSYRRTKEYLFGAGDTCFRYGSPVGIAHFVELTNGKLGSVEEIFSKRTRSIEVRPFLHSALWDKFQHTSHPDRPSGNSGYVKWARYCVECVAEDLSKLGVSYWRVGQQLQGSLVCLAHRKPLEVVVRSGTRWHLPHHCSPSRQVTTSDRVFQTALRLTRFSDATLDLKFICQSSLTEAAIRNLISLGIRSIAPRECGESISQWFSQTLTSEVARIYFPECPALSSGKWIVDLLRARNSPKPALWLLLWTALLESQSEQTALDRFRSVLSDVESLNCVVQTKELSKNMLYRLLHARRRCVASTRTYGSTS